jgi:hypothetical protein
MCKYHLANQNLTKFANYSALFPQVQGNAGQEIRESTEFPKGAIGLVCIHDTRAVVKNAGSITTSIWTIYTAPQQDGSEMAARQL